MNNACMRLSVVADEDIILGIDCGSDEIVQIGICQVSILQKEINALGSGTRPIIPM